MLPKVYAIETVLGCNLACPECAVGHNLIERKYGYMKFEKFCILFDKIKPYCEYLYLHNWGEPLINPDIVPIIKYCSPHTGTNISTNANMITPSFAQRIIGSGVSDIIVSIDGVTQEVYEKYRIKGDVTKALSGLKYLLAAISPPSFIKRVLAKIAKLLGKAGNISTKPSLNIAPQFIVFQHNMHEMKDFELICAQYGTSPCFKAPYLRADSVLSSSSDGNYVRPVLREHEERVAAMSACYQRPTTCPVILLDGSVVACCYDHNGLTTFGNLFTQSFEEIWGSQAYTTFRQNLVQKKGNPFCCKNCMEF